MNLGESPGRVKSYVGSMKLTFPVVVDRDGTVARTYGVRFTPTHILIDRAGIVRAGGSGGKEWNSPAAHAAIGLLFETMKVSEARPGRAESPQAGSETRR